jgi:hypothetical protein
MKKPQIIKFEAFLVKKLLTPNTKYLKTNPPQSTHIYPPLS